MAASRVMFSEKKTPGTFVWIGWNSPRISAGAWGLGSNVSKWLGPPSSQIRMQLVLGAAESPAAPRAKRIDEAPGQKRPQTQFQAVAPLHPFAISMDGRPSPSLDLDIQLFVAEFVRIFDSSSELSRVSFQSVQKQKLRRIQQSPEQILDRAAALVPFCEKLKRRLFFIVRRQTAVHKQIGFFHDFFIRFVAGSQFRRSRRIQQQLVIERRGVHQVQDLRRGRFARPFAGGILIRVGPAERVEEERRRAIRPELSRPRAGGHRRELLFDPQDVVDGVEQHFGPQPLAIVA